MKRKLHFISNYIVPKVLKMLKKGMFCLEIASDIDSEMKEVETAVEEDKREKELAGTMRIVKILTFNHNPKV